MCDIFTVKKYIKSVSSDQTEILESIIKLYVPDGFECDVTYNKGTFYKSIKKPHYKFDINPIGPEVVKADCRNLPLEDAKVKSLVCDLPFICSWRKDSYETKNEKLYTTVRGINNLIQMNYDAMKEALRVLTKKGILVIKCQDTVYANKNYFISVLIYNEAIKLGFTPIDLFIKITKSKFNFNQSQITARKHHSYFWVFRK